MPGPVTDYKIPNNNPGNYRPGDRSIFDPNAPQKLLPGRAFPQTLPSARATNPSEKQYATMIPACAAFSIAPAASAVAAQGRSVNIGAYPVVAYILDESGSEISPPLIVTGPQTFRFGSVARGIRLEQSSLANGSDAAFDVTYDPAPEGEWQAVPPTLVDPRFDAFGPINVPGGAALANQDLTIPRGVRGIYVSAYVVYISIVGITLNAFILFDDGTQGPPIHSELINTWSGNSTGWMVFSIPGTIYAAPGLAVPLGNTTTYSTNANGGEHPGLPKRIRITASVATGITTASFRATYLAAGF